VRRKRNMSEQYLADIASELHSLNLNLCELIKVIKHSNNQPPITPPQLENELEKIQSIHEAELAKKAMEATPAKLEAETEYQKKQEKLDNILRSLGLM
jgi:hypothetical protein